MAILVLLFCQETFSRPSDLEYLNGAIQPTNTAERDARFFKLFKYKLEDYNPYEYYGYGYRPFWGNFGGYVGYFGR